MISIIVAMDRNNIIGVNGEIPWEIPEEIQYFKSITNNKTVIMGRKTYESIGHPLKNRTNIVISKQNLNIPGAIVCKEPILLQRMLDPNRDFVIGGAEIYRFFSPICKFLYLTVINSKQEYVGNLTYFPWDNFNYNYRSKWVVIDQRHHDLYSTYVFKRIMI